MEWFTQLCERTQSYDPARKKSREPKVPARPLMGTPGTPMAASTPVPIWPAPPSATPPPAWPAAPAMPNMPIVPTPPPALSHRVTVATSPRPLVAQLRVSDPCVADIPLPLNDTQPKDTGSIPRAAAADLVLTPTTQNLLRQLALGWRRGRMVLAEGPTSSGKTAAVRYMAWKTQSPYRRINLSDATDVGDLIGRYVGGELHHNQAALAAMDDAALAALCAQYGVAAGDRVTQIGALVRAQLRPHWVDGPVVTALKRGEVLLLDEINLAPGPVVERINSLLDDDGNLVLSEHKGEIVRPNKNFRIFATCNPAQYVGRKTLSDAFRSRCTVVHAPALTDSDVLQIVTARFGAAIPRGELAKLVQVHQHLAELAERRLIGRRNDGMAFTLRDLLKTCERFVHFRNTGLQDAALLRRETEEIYAGGLVDAGDRQTVRDVLQTSMPYNGPDFYQDLQFSEDATTFTIGDVRVRKLQLQGALVPHNNARLVLTDRTKQVFYRLCKALELGENVALIGERATGKTALARMYAHLRGQDYYRQQFSADTDQAQIIGGWDLEGWNDGLLLRAGRGPARPGVYVADEFNLGSPAVLERLNPVLDDEKRLVLAERAGESVRFDPDFRFIAAMNPVGRNNAGRVRLSSAMHNRFTQIYVPDVDSPEELSQIVHTLAVGKGVTEPLAERLLAMHLHASQGYHAGVYGGAQRPQDRPELTLRQLLEALSVVADMQALFGEEEAFMLAIESQYAAACTPTDRASMLRVARSLSAGP